MIENRILKLDEITASKIAAGEVVEKPAMVVKELVENAIDAGSTEITVDISKGGKKKIRVADNGSGIDRSDIDLVFERHATSKIRQIEDLYRTRSLGFRGEALASISAVSEVTLITKKEREETGLKVVAAGGKILAKTEIGTVKGTAITVENLFFNTPARLKFLKSDSAETKAIGELMSHLALSHPEISFNYQIEGKSIFLTPGKGDLANTIFAIYDRNMLNHLFKVEEESLGIKISGFASTYDYTKGNTAYQIVFVNGRFVKSPAIKEAINLAYKPYLMNNRFPVCFLFIEINPNEIDVNIHPQKTEIKFHDDGMMKQLIYTGLKKAFNLQNQIPEVTFSDKEVDKGQVHITSPLKPEPKNPSGSSQYGHASGNESLLKAAEATPPLEQSPSIINEKTVKATSGESSSGQVNAATNDLKPFDSNIQTPSKFRELESEAKRLTSYSPNGSTKETHSKPSDSKTFKRDNSGVNTADKLPKIDFSSYQFDQMTEFANTYDKPVESESIYDGLTYIGSFMNTYLLLQKETDLYMIDQHAAHEKVLYEQFMDAFAKQKIDTQMLLIPEPLNFSHYEVSHIEAHQKVYENAGFMLDIFGTDTIALRGVPSMFDLSSAKALFAAMVEESESNVEDTLSERLMTKACKAAIKAYDAIDSMEVSALLSTLKGLKDPYTCPHGRPIIIKFSKYELERKFKRIV